MTSTRLHRKIFPEFEGASQHQTSRSSHKKELVMIRALYTAASGMSAQQTNLDTVANNLANSATAGFRQRQVQFEDMIYQNLVTPGAAETQQTLSAGLQVGLGTKTAASEV